MVGSDPQSGEPLADPGYRVCAVAFPAVLKTEVLRTRSDPVGEATGSLRKGFAFATGTEFWIYVVGLDRLELSTSTLSEWRSNQLSYRPRTSCHHASVRTRRHGDKFTTRNALALPLYGVRLSEVFSGLTVAGSESDPVKRMYSTDPAARAVEKCDPALIV